MAIAPRTAHGEWVQAADRPDLTLPEREAVTVELDVEVAAMLREHAVDNGRALVKGFVPTALAGAGS